MPRAAIAIVLLGLLVTAPARAAENEAIAALPLLETSSVAKILDGGTILLEDGKTIRLAGIEVPLPPLGHAADTLWVWDEAARSALETLVDGHQVTIRDALPTPDRYGRIIAQVVRDDGLWLEGDLIAQGAVRVQATPETAGLEPAMLQREAAARRDGLGLWQARFYDIRAPGALDHESGSFQIVEAVIRKAEDRHGVIWLDLGENAAARLERPARQKFKSAGLDPLTLAGQKLRLRGWVEWQGRPVLELTHPEAVELLRPRRRD
jgi:micrococcal nuclease